MTNNDNKGANAMPLHFHPFSEDDYKGIGDYVIIPKEVRDLKGTDEYKKNLDEIAEMLKDRIAEEVKRYMTVVIRDGEYDLKTVGVKVFVLAVEKNIGENLRTV